MEKSPRWMVRVKDLFVNYVSTDEKGAPEAGAEVNLSPRESVLFFCEDYAVTVASWIGGEVISI